MGSKPWLIAGAFAALSTLIVGCNSGPQRDTRVLGASNGNPPSMNANGGMPQFPKMDANASAGQPRNGLPSIGATPGNNSFAPASNNSFAPASNNSFAPTSNRALPANTPFSPLDRGNPSLPNSNPGPNFPSSGVTVPNNTHIAHHLR